jgi:acetoin utilization deacetylase AcuC-like enzyme
MQVFWNDVFLERYSADPAAERGRMDRMIRVARARHRVIDCAPLDPDDLRLVHSDRHIASIRAEQRLWAPALTAAGGAAAAAEAALAGTPSFALVRPPGHHASPDSCWGFCFLNNIAVAVARLLYRGAIGRALILDFDLHYGDGTDAAFRGDARVEYLHPEASDAAAFVDQLQREVEESEPFDLLAVSAGFDRYEEDWGGELDLDDYRRIGRIARDAARTRCAGRRFGVLEGGYHHARLGDCLTAFLEGFGDPDEGDLAVDAPR